MFQQPDFNSYSTETPNQKRHILSASLLLGLGAVLIFLFFKVGGLTTSFTIKNPIWEQAVMALSSVQNKKDNLPTPEKNRLDILILGIRGEDDPNAEDGGPLLTDTIQILSYDKITHKSSLVSIPRDLYVEIGNKQDKINAAYEYGISHSPDSLKYIKDYMSRLTGIYIDNVVVFDFSSFKQIVDSLGGVDVTLSAPFKEDAQWGVPFELPAGVNHLDGQQALYYARSRYSSSDFDRSRRQQQIMEAIKAKLFNMNFFSDPIKTINILSEIKKNIDTDIGIWDITNFISLAKQLEQTQIKQYIISTDNLVIQGKSPDNAFILLPKSGDFSEIRSLFQNILNQ